MSAHKKVTVLEPTAITVPSEGDKVLNMIDRVLANPELPVEKLEQMFDLYQKVQASEARKAYDAAMAAAKAKLPVIKKNRTVSYGEGTKKTEYDHEDLGGIASIVDPVLAEFGLSYRFRTSSNPNEPVRVTCIIAHEKGYYEETTLSAGADSSGGKNAIQAIGSTVTYLQRYTLKAALGLAAAKDDDARASSAPDLLSATQVDELFDLIAETQSNVGQFLIVAKVGMETVPETIDGIKEALGNIKARDFDRLKGLLLKKRGRA